MILLIDFEATSVDPKTARIIEIGAMVVDEQFNEPVASMSQLVWESGYPALTPEVEKVTGITQDMLTTEGIDMESAMYQLADMAMSVDPLKAVIAYNRKYDEVLFNSEVARGTFDMNAKVSWLAQIPWLCAMEDIETNYAFKSWRLMHVALEYGVTVNPKLLHRAIADVELMRQMLKASGTSPKAMYDFQKLPWIYVAADVKAPWTDDGKSSAEAKSHGFRWESCGDDRKFPKTWVKKLKANQLEELKHKTNLKLKELL